MVSLVNFCVYTIKFVELVTSNVSVDICLCSFVMILIVMLQLESKNNFGKGQISAVRQCLFGRCNCLIVDRIVGGKGRCSNITVHRVYA